MHPGRELLEAELLQDLCGEKKDLKGLSFMFAGDHFLAGWQSQAILQENRNPFADELQVK